MKARSPLFLIFSLFSFVIALAFAIVMIVQSVNGLVDSYPIFLFVAFMTPAILLLLIFLIRYVSVDEEKIVFHHLFSKKIYFRKDIAAIVRLVQHEYPRGKPFIPVDHEYVFIISKHNTDNFDSNSFINIKTRIENPDSSDVMIYLITRSLIYLLRCNDFKFYEYGRPTSHEN